MDKCQKPLARLRFWRFWAVENPVDKWGYQVEKPAENAVFWSSRSEIVCKIGTFNFLTVSFSKMRKEAFVFWPPKRLIHIIPTCGFHQKWKEKPRKIKGLSTLYTSYAQSYPQFWAF